MSYLLFLIIICFAARYAYLYGLMNGRDESNDDLVELNRWRSGWSNTDRWLAEFPDAADALAHLKANAIGAGGTDIICTRAAMRERRDMAKPVVPTPARRRADVLTAQAAAAREAEFRRAHQHLGPECSGDD